MDYMNISNLEKPNDPNYAPLKMLSFAYTPQPLTSTMPLVYGMIVEFNTDPFSVEKMFLTCYNSGFAAFYSTYSGGNINGNPPLGYSQTVEQSSLELFIGGTRDEFPDVTISNRIRQLLTDACNYLKYTDETIDISHEKEVKFWLLTSAGVSSAAVNLFEVKDKSSVWTNLFNEVYSISLALPCGDTDKGPRSEVVLS